MKIALFNSFHTTRPYAFRIYDGLRKFGVDTTLYYTHYFPLEFPDINIKSIKPQKLPVFRQILNDYYFYANKIPNGFDIYHFTNQGMANYMKKVNGKKVITVHDVAPYLHKGKSFVQDYLTKRIFKNIQSADKVVAISENTKNEVIKYLGIDKNKIDVVYNGITQDKFKILKNKKELKKKLNCVNNHVIITVGHDEPRKNYNQLFYVFKILKQKYPDLLLFCIGHKSPQTDKNLENLGIKDSVRFMYGFDETGMCELYNIADLFVTLSLYEGFGLPPVEAMACGVPVISSNLSSLPEVVGNGGILLDPNDTDKVVNQCVKVLENKKLSKTLIEKGLKQAKKFTWENCAKEYLKIYKSL